MKLNLNLFPSSQQTLIAHTYYVYNWKMKVYLEAKKKYEEKVAQIVKW